LSRKFTPGEPGRRSGEQKSNASQKFLQAAEQLIFQNYHPNLIKIELLE
jgi:hypothetical protein